MRKSVEAWQRCELADATAKVVIYEAFVEGRLEAPKHLAQRTGPVIRTEVRGIPVANNLESVECLHRPSRNSTPIPQFKATTKLVLGGSILSAF